jgi:hypothetical protein
MSERKGVWLRKASEREGVRLRTPRDTLFQPECFEHFGHVEGGDGAVVITGVE